METEQYYKTSFEYGAGRECRVVRLEPVSKEEAALHTHTAVVRGVPEGYDFLFEAGVQTEPDNLNREATKAINIRGSIINPIIVDTCEIDLTFMTYGVSATWNASQVSKTCVALVKNTKDKQRYNFTIAATNLPGSYILVPDMEPSYSPELLGEQFEKRFNSKSNTYNRIFDKDTFATTCAKTAGVYFIFGARKQNYSSKMVDGKYVGIVSSYTGPRKAYKTESRQGIRPVGTKNRPRVSLAVLHHHFIKKHGT